MRRRGATVLVGAALLVLLLWQSMVVRVPYVELGPGPTVDTLGTADGHPVIQVTGATTSNSGGQLRLVTVSVRSDLTLFDAMRGWIRITPPEQRNSLVAVIESLGLEPETYAEELENAEGWDEESEEPPDSGM